MASLGLNPDAAILKRSCAQEHESKDQLLRGTLDYPRWEKRVVQLLRSKGLLHFVLTDDKAKLVAMSPQKSRRSRGDEPTVDDAELDRLSGKAMLILINNVSPQLQHVLDACNGAPDKAWASLKALYGARSSSVRMALRQKLFDIRFDQHQPVTSLVRNVAECVVRLRDFGETISDNEHIDYLVSKIQHNPQWYEKISRLAEQHSRTAFTVGDFVAELYIEQERRNALRPSNLGAGGGTRQYKAFVARGRGGGSKTKSDNDTLCYNCLKEGHSAYDCKVECRICAINPSKCRIKSHHDSESCNYCANESHDTAHCPERAISRGAGGYFVRERDIIF